MNTPARGLRRHPAVHARRRITADPPYEKALAAALRAEYGAKGLLDLYGRYSDGRGFFDALMRRVIWRAAARSFGDGVSVGVSVGFKHLETFEIGKGVFIGDQAYLQGRYDGRLVIGDRTWIGPQVYLDARDLVIGRYVGLGPGVRMLGSQHSGLPVKVPIIATPLLAGRIVIGDEADIGTNACVLPGVTVGKGSIVGAGAVVTRDVEPYSVVAGVPARLLRRRSAPGGAGRKGAP